MRAIVNGINPNSYFLVDREEHRSENKQLTFPVFLRRIDLMVQNYDADEADKVDCNLLAEPINRLALVSDLGHEIRTLLGGIIGIDELLLNTYLDTHQRQLARTIDHSSRTLLEILNDAVDLSRVEEGKLRLELLPVDVRKILQDTAETIQDCGSEEKRIPQVLVEAKVPTVLLGDSQRLQQVLKALTRYSTSTCSGTVTIKASMELEHASTSQIKLSIESEKVEANPAQLAAAFSRTSTTTKYDSTWLSLTLSNRLIHLMGGKSTFKHVGTDRVISFSVPLRNPPPETKI